MQMTLGVFMKSDRKLHQIEYLLDYANGFRTRTTNGFGKEMVLKVPRTWIGVEQKEIFQIETKNATPVASFKKLVRGC